MGIVLMMTTGNAIDWCQSPGEGLITPRQWSKISQFVEMSTREVQISHLLFAGMTRVEIAGELGISPRTVRFHMESLHEKLQVKSRVELVLRLVQLRDFLSVNHN